MILEGNERGGAKDLALHLLKDDNDHVTIHEMRGFMADGLLPAFNEMYAISRGTKAKKYLFSVSLNPPEGEDVPTEVFLKTIAQIEAEFGLEEQQRAIVFHEKNGRRHCHVVWSRIDLFQMKAIKLDYYKNRLMDISRSLFLEYGWKMPRGFMQSEERNPTNFTLKEYLHAKRNGLSAKDIKIIFQDCWAISDSLAAFKHALFERGFILAQGDRAFVALDMNGKIYSVAKQLPKGINKKQIIAKLGEPIALPTVEDARKIIAQIMSDRLNALGQEQHSLIDERLKMLNQKHQELVNTQKAARVVIQLLNRWHTITQNTRHR